MYQNVELKITLLGTGKTKEQAFSDAMLNIQKEVNKKVEGVIIRIEPLKVEILEGICETYTEKFFFFFLKRDVSNFKVKIEVDVRVFIVEINKFEFKKETVKGFFNKK